MSMSSAQQLMPIYNTTVHKNESYVALYVYVRAITWRNQHATRADTNKDLDSIDLVNYITCHLKCPKPSCLVPFWSNWVPNFNYIIYHARYSFIYNYTQLLANYICKVSFGNLNNFYINNITGVVFFYNKNGDSTNWTCQYWNWK